MNIFHNLLNCISWNYEYHQKLKIGNTKIRHIHFAPSLNLAPKPEYHESHCRPPIAVFFYRDLERCRSLLGLSDLSLERDRRLFSGVRLRLESLCLRYFRSLERDLSWGDKMVIAKRKVICLFSSRGNKTFLQNLFIAVCYLTQGWESLPTKKSETWIQIQGYVEMMPFLLFGNPWGYRFLRSFWKQYPLEK